LLAGSALAQGKPGVIVEHDTVLQGTFTGPLSVRDNEPGDHFSIALSDENGIFPKHSRVDGRILRIRWATRFHPASMDLKLDDVMYPNGRIVQIDAVPVPLDSKNVHRGPDGRMYMNMNAVNPGAYWAAGTVGGLVVGGIFHRPFLGGFIGGFIGAIAGAAERDNPDNYRVARKGDKIGVLFRTDVFADGTSGVLVPPPGTPIPPPPTTAPAHREGAEVRFDDHVVNFPEGQKPYWNNDVLMVPLPVMADELDLTVDQRAEGPIYIENEDNMLHLEQGSAEYRLNGAHGTLPAVVENKGDVTYVPIDVIADISARSVYVDGTKLSKKT
jgi:hypothetical protein